MNEETARRPRRGAWSDALGEAFLARLRETGNIRASSRALGQPNLFRIRIARHPDFARAVRTAVAEADARLRLRLADGPFVRSAPVELKSLPEAGPPRPREEVIRRTSNGRLQVSRLRDHDWSSQDEADFLARLRVTGNISASARAIGRGRGTVFQRIEKWPAFARDVELALDEAGIRLDYRLVEYAHRLMHGGEPGEEDSEDTDVPFDPALAMRILTFIDTRKARRTGRGRRKGAPQRSFEEAIESVLAKIDAIEKHERLIRERGEAGCGEG